MRKINDIIIHCSETQEGLDIKAESIKRINIVCDGLKDIRFHYIIDLNGIIEQGRPEIYSGNHCTNHDDNSISICYIGGRDKKMCPKDTRTDELKKALIELVKKLIGRYNLSLDNVHCHNDYDNSQSCPSFTRDSFVKEYIKYYK